MDPGEDDMQTALRETEEECGYKREDVTVDKEKKIELRYEVRGKQKTTVYFVAELKVGKKMWLSPEHTEHRWLGIEEACVTAKYQDLQGALREVHSYVTA